MIRIRILYHVAAVTIFVMGFKLWREAVGISDNSQWLLVKSGVNSGVYIE